MMMEKQKNFWRFCEIVPVNCQQPPELSREAKNNFTKFVKFQFIYQFCCVEEKPEWLHNFE